MQLNPDNNYKCIMIKFVILRPLKFKRVDEVAYCLFDILGASNILYLDNEREFVNAVISDLYIVCGLTFTEKLATVKVLWRVPIRI